MKKQMNVALAMYDVGIELDIIEKMTQIQGVQLLWYWIHSKDESTV
ncbi:MAG: hypothetical protein IJC38_00475 [Erysipelotrichaceae bacterium]|nr:hypothetical protein [Erysipelotrichaceae bacterium]